MDKKIRVGVIGCGEIAQTQHLRYLWELPGFEIGAICDISPEVLDQVGELYGVNKRFIDYRDLVKQDDLEAVLVTSHDHADPAVASLAAGKHVMTEKPIAFNLRLADEMILAAKENHRKLMVAYNRRYDPGFEWALSYLKSVDIPQFVRIHDFGGSFASIDEMYHPFKRTDVPRQMLEAAKLRSREEAIEAIGKDREELASLYQSLVLLCSHDSNLLHEAFGRPSKILHAEAYGNWFVLALLELESGAQCVWETGLLTGLPEWDQQLSAYSNHYRMHVSFKFPYLKNSPSEVNVKQMEGSVYTNKQITSSYDEAFKRECAHFYDCIVNDREPITSGEKARMDVEFLIELVKQVKR